MDGPCCSEASSVLLNSHHNMIVGAVQGLRDVPGSSWQKIVVCFYVLPSVFVLASHETQHSLVFTRHCQKPENVSTGHVVRLIFTIFITVNFSVIINFNVETKTTRLWNYQSNHDPIHFPSREEFFPTSSNPNHEPRTKALNNSESDCPTPTSRRNRFTGAWYPVHTN